MRLGRRSAHIALIFACGALAAAAFSSMPKPTRGQRGELFVPRPDVARLTALGFDALISDYYWLQAVQRVGASTHPTGLAPLIGRLIDVVTTLNPWVGHPYRFAAVWMIDSPESVRQANHLLERGVAAHPDDWRNHFYLGFNHFFYLEDVESAVGALERAIELRGAPVYLKRLVARLKAQKDGLETSAAFLQELVRDTKSPRERAKYERALDEIETERRARWLDQAHAEFRQRFGRNIESVEDLTRGPDPVRDRIPPEPHGWEWVVHPKRGHIYSSYYGHRYEPQFHRTEKKRRRAWREQLEAEKENAER